MAHLHLAPFPAPARNPPKVRREIRIVLAEGHSIMRRSLRLLLEDEADLQVVAEADGLSEVMREMHRHRPQVLVLDLGMHNGLSIKVLRSLRQQVPGSEIVVVTMEESPAFAQRALEAGAVAFIRKDRADTELPDAVRSAARGEEYVSASVSAGLNLLRRKVGKVAGDLVAAVAEPDGFGVR